jgi:hypothetical protein
MFLNRKIPFFLLTNTYLQVLRKERTSTKCLNVPKDGAKDKRSEAYKEMIHWEEEQPHQKWTDGVASPRKERQKPMIMRILGPLAPRRNVV